MKIRLRTNRAGLLAGAFIMAALALMAPLAGSCGAAVAGYLASLGGAAHPGLSFPVNEMGEAGLQYLTLSSLAGIFVLGSCRFRRE